MNVYFGEHNTEKAMNGNVKIFEIHTGHLLIIKQYSANTTSHTCDKKNL